jgi:PAS domain S-box-containing protein
MKKYVIIILIIVQLLLLFLFQNLYFLFRELETVDLNDMKAKAELTENINQMKKTFSLLSIIIALFLIVSGIYLGFLYKKSREVVKLKDVSPLQTYLRELRTSEIELKDIVEKQKESASSSEELNRNIVNNINSAIVFVNQHNRIDIFNKNAEKIFNQSYVNAKNNTLENVMRPYRELIRFLDTNRDKKVSSEIQSSGRVFWLDSIPIRKLGTLIIIRDVTEDRQREEIDRRNKNFMLLGEMTGYLTHEIRNSLGAIYGYSKALQSELKESGKQKIVEKVNNVNKEIEQLTASMESFLNFSKPISVEAKKKINLVDLIKKVGQENQISISLPSKEIELTSDPVLINSIFSNLVINAKEAGANRIKMTIDETEPMEILFEDNGKGIKPEIQNKIWLPLFTTKKNGTGMGLAIVRKIINSLKGDIRLVESTGRGTIYKIVLFP